MNRVEIKKLIVRLPFSSGGGGMSIRDSNVMVDHVLDTQPDLKLPPLVRVDDLIRVLAAGDSEPDSIWIPQELSLRRLPADILDVKYYVVECDNKAPVYRSQCKVRVSVIQAWLADTDKVSGEFEAAVGHAIRAGLPIQLTPTRGNRSLVLWLVCALHKAGLKHQIIDLPGGLSKVTTDCNATADSPFPSSDARGTFWKDAQSVPNSLLPYTTALKCEGQGGIKYLIPTQALISWFEKQQELHTQ